MDLRPLVLPRYRSAVETIYFLVGSRIADHDLRVVEARWLLLEERLCLCLLVGGRQATLYLPLFDRSDECRLFNTVAISILNLLTRGRLAVLAVRLLSLRAATVRILHELQIDVVRISYLLGQPQLARIHRA